MKGNLGLQNSGIKNSQLRGKKHEIILKEIMSFIYNVHCYLTFKSNLSQAHSLNVGTHIKLSYAAVEIKRLSNVHCSEWWKTCTLKNNCDVLPWDRKQTYNRITISLCKWTWIIHWIDMNQQNYTKKHSNIFDTIDRLINMHVVRLGFKNCYIHRMKNKK